MLKMGSGLDLDFMLLVNSRFIQMNVIHGGGRGHGRFFLVAWQRQDKIP